MVTQVGKSIFLVGQPRPHPLGAGPQRPSKFWDPYIRPNGLIYLFDLFSDTDINRVAMNVDQNWYGSTCGVEV